jgi:anti-sigma B factor antagonist
LAVAVVELFEVSHIDGVPVVTAPVDIDMRNAGQLRAALRTAADASPTIIADLGGTEFCDSSGLQVLVRALRRAQADGGEVRLVARSAAILRLLAITGIGRIFPLYQSVTEAVANPATASTPAF